MMTTYSEGYLKTKHNIDHAKFTAHGILSAEEMKEIARFALHDLLNQDYLKGVINEEENEELHAYIDQKYGGDNV